MTPQSYDDLVTGYLDDPSPSVLSELRRAVRSAPNFTADLDLAEIDTLLAERDYAAALHALRALLPGATFNPGFHARLALALEHTGDPGKAARESHISRAAMESIAGTGDGSTERPYSVLRINDEYDALRAMGKVPERQSVLSHDGRVLDRHLCSDESVVHFDVTALFGG